MKTYSLHEGELLVKAARNAIEIFVGSAEFRREAVEKGIEELDQKHGVFVTIYHYPTRTLRGCIGFTEATEPVKRMIVDAAIAAATEDPRFVPVSHLEFDHITIEVSVLSKAERMAGSPDEIKDQIKIGRDGLVIDYGYHRGLLLPAVPVEEGWGAEEFLDNLCTKAGLKQHVWKQRGVALSRFSTQVFAEAEPRGRVRELRLEEL
ncbi:Uncharacterised protein [uncultured archaeon]|nr:Uncharacterised protein [uncultured archaeon]